MPSSSRKKIQRKIKKKTIQEKETCSLNKPTDCCQATTIQGTRCTRKAKWKLDLTKKRNILGFNIPTINCCFFCTQHALKYASVYGISFMYNYMKGQLVDSTILDLVKYEQSLSK